MTLTQADVTGAIRSLLPALERLGDRVLVVGTASSLLRGIELPAGDVDILAKERVVVDDLTREADRAGVIGVAAPGWVDTPFGGQYIADYDAGGVVIQVSTVELGAPEPGRVAECTGDAPWRYSDRIDVEGYTIGVVASELRLLSEVERGRADRWGPIASHLREHGYDEHLLGAALAWVPSDAEAEIRRALATAPEWGG